MRARICVAGVVAAVAMAVLLPAICCADLTVKEETQMSGMMGMLSSKGVETTYIKGEKMRAESAMQIGGAVAGMMQGMGMDKTPDVASITRLDKGVIWVVNNDDKTYTEMSLKAGKADSSAQPGMKVKDLSVKKTGLTREIIGYKCEGVEVNLTVEIAAGEGKQREVRAHAVKTLFWMRPDAKGLEELRHFWDQMVEVARVSQQGNPMAEAMGPVFGKLKEIQGVPLGIEMTMDNPLGSTGMDAEEQAEMKAAMKMMQQMMESQGEDQSRAADEGDETSGDQIRMTRYVTSISKGALGDAMFEIPKGYTKTEGLEGMFMSPKSVPGK
ncbi:MAG: DUF4412 domain-containing protein [bacterium]